MRLIPHGTARQRRLADRRRCCRDRPVGGVEQPGRLYVLRESSVALVLLVFMAAITLGEIDPAQHPGAARDGAALDRRGPGPGDDVDGADRLHVGAPVGGRAGNRCGHGRRALVHALRRQPSGCPRSPRASSRSSVASVLYRHVCLGGQPLLEWEEQWDDQRWMAASAMLLVSSDRGPGQPGPGGLPSAPSATTRRCCAPSSTRYQRGRRADDGARDVGHAHRARRAAAGRRRPAGVPRSRWCSPSSPSGATPASARPTARPSGRCPG